MWRNATSLDDENIVSMCMALNADDPGPVPVYPQQMCRTLAILRKEPHRGRALVCEINGDPAGYALLIFILVERTRRRGLQHRRAVCCARVSRARFGDRPFHYAYRQ